MDKIFLDNTVKSYILFTVVFIGGIIMAFIFNKIIKNYKSKENKGFFNSIILFLINISFSIGIVFFDNKTVLSEKFFIFSKFLYIVSVSWFIMELIIFIMNRVLKMDKFRKDPMMVMQIQGLVSKLVYTVIGIISLSLFLGILGFNMVSLLTGLGIGGLAVALAAQDFLSNVLGGVTIFMSHIIEVGDYVRIGEDEGFVHFIGLRTTKLKTLQGQKIIIPNNTVMKSVVMNHSTGSLTLVRYMIGLTYTTSTEKLKRAIAIIREILENDDRIPNKDKIAVGFYKFDAYSLNIYIGFYIRNDADAGNIKQDFHFKVKEAFDNEKIEIAFPTTTVFLEK